MPAHIDVLMVEQEVAAGEASALEMVLAADTVTQELEREREEIERAGADADGFHAQAQQVQRDGTDEFVAAEALAALQLKERTCRIAARKGDLATLEEVQGIKLNAVHDHHMKTLLHVAAIEGKAAVAQMLADKFATEDPTFIQSVDVNHRTALEYAVSSGHDDVAKILVAVNFFDRKQPLVYNMLHPNKHTVQMFDADCSSSPHHTKCRRGI